MSEAQDHPGRFAPGQSGNPAGRPKGARHRVTLAVETLLAGEAEGLTRKAVEMALAGDASALRLCLERICPAKKGRTVTLSLPRIDTSVDVLSALGDVLAAVAEGEITIEEAQTLATILETKRRAIESADLEVRVEALEAKQ